MKNQFTIATFAIVCLIASLAVAAEPTTRPVRLFVLSGQSNMKGLDPAVSFTPAIEKAFPENENVIVKVAASGQLIRLWYKKWTPPQGQSAVGGGRTGQTYDALMAAVKKEMEGKPSPVSITFVWMQGEADGMTPGYGKQYKEALEGLIGQLRADLGRKDIDVVIGRISDHQAKSEKYPDWDAVRKVEVDYAEANPRAAWVDTDDLNNTKDGRDDLHYTQAGYKLLGERFAEKAIELIKKSGEGATTKPAK
jgi:hypothetical protein